MHQLACRRAGQYTDLLACSIEKGHLGVIIKLSCLCCVYVCVCVCVCVCVWVTAQAMNLPVKRQLG